MAEFEEKEMVIGRIVNDVIKNSDECVKDCNELADSISKVGPNSLTNAIKQKEDAVFKKINQYSWNLCKLSAIALGGLFFISWFAQYYGSIFFGILAGVTLATAGIRLFAKPLWKIMKFAGRNLASGIYALNRKFRFGRFLNRTLTRGFAKQYLNRKRQRLVKKINAFSSHLRDFSTNVEYVAKYSPDLFRQNLESLSGALYYKSMNLLEEKQDIESLSGAVSPKRLSDLTDDYQDFIKVIDNAQGAIEGNKQLLDDEMERGQNPQSNSQSKSMEEVDVEKELKEFNPDIATQMSTEDTEKDKSEKEVEVADEDEKVYASKEELKDIALNANSNFVPQFNNKEEERELNR